MSFFISDALAEAAPAAAQQGDPITALLFPIGLIVLFYFFLIRPQSKRAKEHKAMTEGLQKGDEVVTQGGILGKITNVGENFITLEISDNVTINVQRAAIGALMPKGTIKENKAD
jgi:preprotein translocase subunit YajC